MNYSVTRDKNILEIVSRREHKKSAHKTIF